jgi:hypothetical protein
MVVELRGDIGSAGSPTQKYLLRYEGLQPPVSKPPYPDPSPLEVYLVESS